MFKLSSPRGTRDLLPDDFAYWQPVRQAAQEVAEEMGFAPLSTPTYEEREVFDRGIGEGTDVMDKELFIVRGIKADHRGEEYALRPEGTAGIVRSFIEHGMHTWPQPVKLYSFVNCFRYDRPQRGRYREHIQFDLEYFGEATPFSDAWVIYANWRFLQKIGLTDAKVLVNTLGLPEEREEYLERFKAYLEPHFSKLSADSQARFKKNPLRILDSKDINDKALCNHAPKLADSLQGESRAHFEQVLLLLKDWNVPYEVDPTIVRGLDYYRHTTFEWVLPEGEGQQSSLGGGGRYDGLLPQLNGPVTGAVGAGMGLDRIVEALKDREWEKASRNVPELFIVAADEAGLKEAPLLMAELLKIGWRVDSAFAKESMGAQLKGAGKSGAKAALLLGTQEVTDQTVTVKDLTSGEQTNVPRAELRNHLRQHFVTHAGCHCAQ